MPSLKIPGRRRTADGAPERERNLLSIYRPVLKGKTVSVLVMAASSFIAGISEGLLLVMVANIALAVGSQGADDALSASLGPFSDLNLTLRVSFVVALALGLIRFTFQMLAAHLAAKLTADLTQQIRAETFRDYAGASWAEQSRHEESDIQDLLLRHVNRQTASIGVLATAISSACTLVALLASAVLVDPIAAVLLCISGAILFIAIRPLSRIGKRVSLEGQAAGLAYGQRSLEAIHTSLEMRAFGVTDEVSDRLAKATAAEARPTYTTVLLRQAVTSLYQMVMILLLLGGLLGSYLFLDQKLGSLGAIVVILIRALTQSGALQNAYHLMADSAPYFEKLDEERQGFRDAVPRAGSVHITEPRHLVFDHLSYSYVPGVRALDNLSFEVSAGEAIGIIGPSGSGKSTLIQLLLRLRDPDSGHFRIDGIDACDIEQDDWFKSIALVPQESRLINGTVRDNIAFFRSITDDEVVRAAQRAHIHDEILAMPDGYDTALGSRGGALSGGQRQRISIARALARQPSILVLDEPTSALDMRSESLVHETLIQLKGSVTLFAIAHRLSTLNTCDRIIVMQDGKIQAFGARKELEQDSAFYRDALRLSKIRD